jgi:hypothetical protein
MQEKERKRDIISLTRFHFYNYNYQPITLFTIKIKQFLIKRTV